MTGKTYISGGLYAGLLTIYLHVAQLLFLPSALMRYAGQEAWIAVVLNGLYAAALGLVAAWSAERYRGQGPVQAARTALGRWGAVPFALLYCGFFTWLLSLVLRNVRDFVEIVLLQGTPGLVIVVMLGAITLYAVWSGLESVARLNVMVVLGVIAASIALIVLPFKEYSILHLEPFLFHGMGSVVQASSQALAWSGEVVLVLTLVPHLQPGENVSRWTLIGVGGATAVLTNVLLLESFTFGPILPTRLIFPTFELFRIINLAHIVERVELVLVVLWITGMVMKTSLCLYAASEAVSEAVGLKSHRWAGVILTIVAVALTEIWQGALNLISWVSSQQFRVLHSGIEWAILAFGLVIGLLQPRPERGAGCD